MIWRVSIFGFKTFETNETQCNLTLYVKSSIGQDNLMGVIAKIMAWVNIPSNIFGKLLLAPVGVLQGWFSITIISAVAGVALLAVFKYISDQETRGKIWDSIHAHMLSLRLFKDSLSVTMRAEAQIFKGAFFLLVYSIIPLLVIIIPVTLLLAQMGQWYQVRPLNVGEQAIVIMKLNHHMGEPFPEVSLDAAPAAEVTAGPVRVLSKGEIYWKIRAIENGKDRLFFNIDNKKVEKALSVGDGFSRVSVERPGWNWTDILMYPLEKPFGADSMITSIAIDYPDRESKICGTNWWVFYFFIVSMIFAVTFMPVLKVR